MSELAPDKEMALDLGIGPRLGTNPRSESNIYTNMEHSIWMSAGLHSPTADRPRWWTTEDFARAMIPHNKSCSSSQQACNVKMTSHRCWCGVITLHRRRHDTSTTHTITKTHHLGRLKNYKYSQTCLKGSPKGRTKSGILRQVTP